MRLLIVTASFIPLILWSCAGTTATTGNDFNSAVVPRIQTGVTPASQLLQWLGDPYYKKPVSANDMIWLYAWSRQKVDTTIVPFGKRSIGNAGFKKTLWIYIRNDVVVSYGYEEKIL